MHPKGGTKKNATGDSDNENKYPKFFDKIYTLTQRTALHPRCVLNGRKLICTNRS